MAKKIVFAPGNMDQNFKLLLVYFGLLKSTEATKEEVAEAEIRVKELIPSFNLSRNGVEPTIMEVGEGLSKSGLFILFLAEGKEKLHRSSTDRELTEMFFTPEIVSDAKNKRKRNHAVVRALLGEGSLTIEVEAPISEQQEEKLPEGKNPPIEKMEEKQKPGVMKTMEKKKKKDKKKKKNKKKKKK